MARSGSVTLYEMDPIITAHTRTRIATVALVVLALFGGSGLASCGSDTTSTSSESNPTGPQANPGNVIETSAFRLTAPDGARNNSKSVDKGWLSFKHPMSYGTLDVSVIVWDLEQGEVTRDGTVTETDVVINGVKATRVDTADISVGPSPVDYMRHRIDFEYIPKPSKVNYTQLSIVLFHTQDVPASGIAEFRADAQAIIDSLVIK